jgi:RNA polymerase sigma-70 factor (ECF subfamily)
MPTAEAAVQGGVVNARGDPISGIRTQVTSFDSIYEAHFAFVWRVLGRLGVASSLLDDATQDVFVVVHRQLSGFEGRSSVKTWLSAIALRVARDYRRSARRRGSLVPLEESVTPSERPTPLDQAQHAEAARLLYRFLDSLDEHKRAVFVVSELEEMTAPEIARALDASVNTVYARLRTARRLFVEAVRSKSASDGGTADA